MFKAIFSIIIWPIWSIVFLFGTIIYSIAIMIFPAYKLHRLAQIIARTCMLFGAQWFKVEGLKPDANKGPYLYLINHLLNSNKILNNLQTKYPPYLIAADRIISYL